MEKRVILRLEDNGCTLILYKVEEGPIPGDTYRADLLPLFEDMELKARTQSAATQELGVIIRNKAQVFVAAIHKLAQAISPTARRPDAPLREPLQSVPGRPPTSR